MQWLLLIIGTLVVIAILCYSAYKDYINELYKCEQQIKKDMGDIQRAFNQLGDDINTIKHHFNTVDMEHPYDDIIAKCDELLAMLEEAKKKKEQ
jgi:hypothetical protein